MRNAFFHPITRVLKAHGFVETNEPGDLVVEVDNDFQGEPGFLKLAADGKTFEAHEPPPQIVKSAADLILEDPVELQKLKAALGL